MQLTKEQHAKVFGLYIGSKVIYPDGEIVTIVGITPYEGMIQVLKSNGDVDWWNYHDAKLILTPLSEITDEDAAMVATLNRYMYEENKAIVGRDILRRIFDDPNPVMCLPYECADYLRSKSYMVPYLGVDLYEKGIAIKPKEVK